MSGDATHGFAPYVIPLLVVALVAFRLVRNEPRKVKPNRLFIIPVVLALAAGFTLQQMPAPGWIWYAVYLAAGVLGAGVGYLSARHREFSLDPESHEIMARATPTGTLLVAALFALRYSLKLIFPQLGGGQSFAAAAHPAGNVIGWTDAGLVFSTAMLLSAAATTWWHTRHLATERRRRLAHSGEAAAPRVE